VLAVEDSPSGLAAAAEAGFLTLGVAQSYPAARLQGGADQVVDSLRGMTLAKLERLF
jgi:beta-phosphoglucomutase-like phosphatase (HAD superfamily)